MPCNDKGPRSGWAAFTAAKKLDPGAGDYLRERLKLKEGHRRYMVVGRDGVPIFSDSIARAIADSRLVSAVMLDLRELASMIVERAQEGKISFVEIETA
jgi:predicted regulator of Ras-like GTPase activity (Roadblock/LC7/MglB family)